jgi:thioredoxin reductase (NADPH)
MGHLEGRLEPVGDRLCHPLFILIGSEPRTDWLAGTLERDRAGFILTGRELGVSEPAGAGLPAGRTPFPFESSVPGVFAVGDVRAGSVKRVASGVGEGSVAIRVIHQFLDGD